MKKILYPVRQKECIKLPCAVVFENGSFLHSVMASNNSMWSVGQRKHAARKKGQRLSGEKTILTLSMPVAEQIAGLVAVYKAPQQKRTLSFV